MGESKTHYEGYKCPVRGCLWRNNRRFSSVAGLVQHMESKHPGEVEKRLRAKISPRKK